ncbi:hypothetical protein ISF_03307 [Cordyceps fumosorosea ARSEF 2679]|uniref:DUF3835 domain-containing protein n=1 Tax=Cordyceps fumosorosea (strain ARSEF 2679) TaxID=1081104 RepID=A0A162JH71_CORFA|nr:hypothetical protein ISF_03307 [Cordyceps fumosorosea ARSEF 2679]OAA68932.1 hypothetical protein ISF_03307 [Cordyceps fumosorosea ARSEF 2679]
MAGASQAPPVHEALADMDSHIARLKDKVEEQRKGLQHWQPWDAEYEALKEEVQALAESATVEDLQRIRAGFDGELLVGKELDEIFGQQQRSRDQIVNVLDRRIDYVNQNVRTLQTQLEKTELEVLDAEASNEQGAVDENGPPITEIVEELDQDDNVLSFRLNRPGEALPRVKAALEKAGIDAPSLEPPSLNRQSGSASPSVAKPPPAKKVKESIPVTPHESEPDHEVTPPISRMAKRVGGIMKTAKQQESISSQPAIIPDDEDPDDAALRQQMLKYSMGEMGAVVAELNLEENDDDDDNFDDDEWLEGDGIDDDDDDEEDGEDKYGRFTGRMITDKYQRRMLELETKLGVKSRFTQKLEEEAAERDSDDDDGEGIGRIRIQPKPKPSSSASPSAAPTKSIVKEMTSAKNEPKKGVRFANELDIADEAEPSATLPESKRDSGKDIVEPMSELIVERKAASKPAAAPPSQRPSRFKKAAQNQPSIPKGPLDVPASFLAQHVPDEEELPVPTGPEGRTIADTLVEKGSVSRPAGPAVVDDSMMGVAAEHQRLRSRFIRRDGGGFLQEDEGPVQELDETEGGGQRVSRFKAARLSRH